MSYRPSRKATGGLPYTVAEMYGKPHIGCEYFGSSVNSHHLLEDAMCVCCGKLATNAHHFPPKGTCPTFTFRGRKLKPALFALCGSGTTGCHGQWHSPRRYTALWKWDSEKYAKAWWEGDLLGEYEPHAPQLYLFGCWEVYDLLDGRIWEVRL